MIFAEIESELSGTEYHHELVKLIEANFSGVESGLQGDSWIWISDDSNKVEVDTFSSMNHQIKSNKEGILLVKQVIDCLSTQYNVQCISFFLWLRNKELSNYNKNRCRAADTLFEC